MLNVSLAKYTAELLSLTWNHPDCVRRWGNSFICGAAAWEGLLTNG